MCFFYLFFLVFILLASFLPFGAYLLALLFAARGFSLALSAAVLFSSAADAVLFIDILLFSLLRLSVFLYCAEKGTSFSASCSADENKRISFIRSFSLAVLFLTIVSYLTERFSVLL